MSLRPPVCELRRHHRTASVAATAAALTLLASSLSGTAAADGPEGARAQSTVPRTTTPPRQTLVPDLIDSTDHHLRRGVASSLTNQLGPTRTGGAYVSATDDLVVTVVGSQAAAQVRRAGARPQRVRFSTEDLQLVHTALDRYARRHDAGKVRGWYVDVSRNTVMVTVGVGHRDQATTAFLDFARGFDRRVTIERAAGDVQPATYLYGGQRVDMSNGYVCTSAFNARTADGTELSLTAGHCAQRWPHSWRNGFLLGRTHGYSYPVDDYAALRIGDPGYWKPQPAVDMHNGYARPILGHTRPPVGTRICKSGRRTGWTCGTILAFNQTVNYGNGAFVYGLVRHNACVGPGDSGGPTLAGNYAVGITSGAQFYRSGSRPVCGQTVGRPNVSFYQPIGEALNAFDAVLLTD